MSATVPAPTPFRLPDDLSGYTVGRFHVRHRIGAGGMGEVYYADDLVLRRPVALKRILPKFRDPKARRHFLAEAQRASTLSSEHIATVFDVVEEANEIFLVLEYVEGISLRRELQHSGRLGLDRFLPIARQCAQALVEAQNRNIVHCDLKPENIMLTGKDSVKLLDFGLACHYSSSESSSATTLSQPHLAGTPGYMAPEVLLEQKIDARADIFSLGIVFYEMLAGKNPFYAEHVIAATDRTLHAEPAALRDANPEVPESLQRIILKMLAKLPAERYATAADLLCELSATADDQRPQEPSAPASLRTKAARIGQLLALASIIFIVFSAPSYRWIRSLFAPDLPQKKQLAILPFVADGKDAELQAFSHGLTETLTARLTQFSDRYSLQVVSPREVHTMATASVSRARAELGVNLVLEGSVRQSGNRLRVVHRLLEAGTQRVLRADAVTADLGDSFALEDRVVDSALRSLELEFGTGKREAARGTTQPAAYDFYLRGRGYLLDYQQPENIESAISVFQRALQIDSDFALAYAGLGESYWRKYELTHDRQWVGQALEACEQSRARGSGHGCLGSVYNGTGRYTEAASEFRQALDADANDPDAYRGLALAYERLGKLEDAEQTYRRARDLRPDYWGGYNWLGVFFYTHGRYGEAAEMFTRVTELAPDNVRGYSNLCGIYIAMGHYADAVPPCERSVGIRPSQPAYSNLGTVYFYQHRYADAAAVYQKAVRLDERLASSWGNLGDAYYWQPGKHQEAVAAYRKAILLGEDELKVNSRDAVLLSYLAVHHAMVHDNSVALAEARRALSLAPSEAEVQLNAALVACQLGDHETAVARLHKAVQSGLAVDLVRNHPRFDVLRSTRAFRDLIADPLQSSNTQ